MSSIREDYVAGVSVEQIVAKRQYKPGMIRVIREQLREAGLLRQRGAKRTATFEDGRRCSQCNEVLPLNEQYFYKDRTKVEGYKCACKECVKNAKSKL